MQRLGGFLRVWRWNTGEAAAVSVGRTRHFGVGGVLGSAPLVGARWWTGKAAVLASGHRAGSLRPRGEEVTPHRLYSTSVTDPIDLFPVRHIGTNPNERKQMLASLGFTEYDELISNVIPDDIRCDRLNLGRGRGELEAIVELRRIARMNMKAKNHIGMGYYDTITPTVLLRNMLENPQWYTPYTPYQAEIAQGRLEALLVYQTVVSDLTGLPIANASLLDEATAAAEAIAMSFSAIKKHAKAVFVSELCHPQTLAVIQTRMAAVGVTVHVGDHNTFDFEQTPVCAVLVQTPCTDGRLLDLTSLRERVDPKKALLVVGGDLLAMTVTKPPGEFGADVVYGSAQRFGVPVGGGGPHAAFISCRADLVRCLPGRIIGVSRDAQGNKAMRMALQTREQHIRRERASSNICTAQALLAGISGMYSVWHGPAGLQKIANRVHRHALLFARGLKEMGFTVSEEGGYFDTVKVTCSETIADRVVQVAAERKYNLRRLSPTSITVSMDEPTTTANVDALLGIFGEVQGAGRGAVSMSLPLEAGLDDVTSPTEKAIPPSLRRTTAFLTHEVFHAHRSETAMMRYLQSLANKDYGLQDGIIPLGSCTMKLNAAIQMIPILWSEFMYSHPFAPRSQIKGYQRLFDDCESMLADVTGFAGCTLQPNAGSQGELTGLLMIRKYHEDRGDADRKAFLIPASAHGTNPASVVVAGCRVQPVKSNARGDIDVDDLRQLCEKLGPKLAGLVVTYPSTHGVFEESIREICDTVHEHGGLVYMDGANMNAQCGLTSPAAIGADCCHLNLHKTFCIPHGGGGPGLGPVCVNEKLLPYLPGHPSIEAVEDSAAIGAIAAAPYSSAMILPIPWMYLRLMGSHGLREASQCAILHANYLAHELRDVFPTLYTNEKGYVGHEFIIDLRGFKASCGIEAVDVAKRLQDYGIHAPTMSFPVANTLMIEPTESETLQEMQRLVLALKEVRKEIKEIEDGLVERDNNVLKNAPHTMTECISDEWTHPYSREKAAFPIPVLKERKQWPTVKRVDEVYGDRNIRTTI